MSPSSPQCPRQLAQTIRLVSFPNNLSGKPPEPFYMLPMGTDKSEGRNASGEFSTHIA